MNGDRLPWSAVYAYSDCPEIRFSGQFVVK